MTIPNLLFLYCLRPRDGRANIHGAASLAASNGHVTILANEMKEEVRWGTLGRPLLVLLTAAASSPPPSALQTVLVAAAILLPQDNSRDIHPDAFELVNQRQKQLTSRLAI